MVKHRLKIKASVYNRNFNAKKALYNYKAELLENITLKVVQTSIGDDATGLSDKKHCEHFSRFEMYYSKCRNVEKE